MADLQYRPITDLTDEEIVSLLPFYCNVQHLYEESNEPPLPNPELLSIARDKDNHQVTATFKAWVRDPEDDSVFEVEDVIDIDEYGNVDAADFGFSCEELHDVQCHLIAYGCHPLLKDNPYLK